MRKSAVAIPILALIAGVVGFIVRRMEINTAFENVTGFAKSNAPSTAILITLSVVVVVLAVVLAVMISSKNKAENDFTKAFAAKGIVYLLASFLLGIGWLAADVIYYFEMTAIGISIIDIIFIFFAAVSAFSIMFLARGAYKGRAGSEILLLAVVPPIFFCFWLIVLYKNNAANPVLLEYAFQCIAIAAAALSFYYSAGYVFSKTRTGFTLFSFLVTIYLCLVVLADNIGLSLKLFFGITAVVMTMNLSVFLGNLKHKH